MEDDLYVPYKRWCGSSSREDPPQCLRDIARFVVRDSTTMLGFSGLVHRRRAAAQFLSLWKLEYEQLCV